MARPTLFRFVAVVASLALVAGLFGYGTPSSATATDMPMHAASDVSSPDPCDGCSKDGTCRPAADCLAQCGAAYALPMLASISPVIRGHVQVDAAVLTLSGRGEAPDPHPPK